MRYFKKVIKSSNDHYIIGHKKSILRESAHDYLLSILKYQSWTFLGWQDIKLRYKRSLLGPLWITISTAIMISTMGMLYGGLFKIDLAEYFPFLAIGLIIWSYFSSVVTDACQVFENAGPLIKQTRLPISIYCFRMVWRNILIFFHNLIVFVFVCFYFNKDISFFNLIYSLLGFVFVSFTAVHISILIGSSTIRYRDLSPVIMSLMQVSFFLTPIMWMPNVLNSRNISFLLIKINPFYNYIEIIRAPLLSDPFPWFSWCYSISVTFLLMLITLVFLGKYKHRIVYWL